MPEHYAVLEVTTLIQLALQAYRDLKSPLAGYIQDIYYSVGSNLPSDAVFNVRLNGTSLWAGDLTQRPKILSGASSGSKLGINAAIVAGDLIQFDADTVPSGGLPIPFFTRVTLYDTIALRSTIIYITGSLADLATESSTIPLMGRGWKLISIAADRACWVRAYTTVAARTADAGRLISADATENSGLCAEVILTASLLSVGYGAPFPEGYNLDDPTSTNGIFSIQNRSGGTSTVQLTLQRLVLER